MHEATFCPSCGQPVNADDRYCRHCAHPLGPDGTTTARSRSRLAWLAPGLLLIAAGSAAGVLAAGGVFADDNADERAAQLAEDAQRRIVEPDFNELMAERDELFAQERRYLATMADARRAIREYRADDGDFQAENKRIDEEFADEWDQCARFEAIPCPSPEYPDPPKSRIWAARARSFARSPRGCAAFQRNSPR
jgi:hypothetical protein